MSKTRNASKVISSLMSKKGKTTAQLAEHQSMGIQSMRNKLSRSNYKVEDLIEFAEFLGVDVGFKDGDEFISILDK